MEIRKPAAALDGKRFLSGSEFPVDTGKSRWRFVDQETRDSWRRFSLKTKSSFHAPCGREMEGQILSQVETLAGGDLGAVPTEDAVHLH